MQFFYHPDHLGSSNYITDASGEVYQHNEYFPYGETFVEERNAAEYTNYLFSGKELDEETGFYYFGARYYNPIMSTFANIDPKVDIYPNWSPYSYCFGNPVILIDPDGRGPIPRGVKSDYKGSAWYQKPVIFLNNTAVGLGNVPIDIVNGCIDESVFIYNNGAGAYFNEVGKSFANMGKAIAADFSRPFSEQMQGLANDLSNPEFYEDFAANVVMLIAAKKIPTPKATPTPKVVAAGGNVAKSGFKTITELGLKDGMKVSSSKALELGEKFLGKGYKELKPGSGRFVSADGKRVFRMGTNDITGAHGGGPHVNFETLIPNPAKPGKMMVDKNIHLYLTD